MKLFDKLLGKNSSSKDETIPSQNKEDVGPVLEHNIDFDKVVPRILNDAKEILYNWVTHYFPNEQDFLWLQPHYINPGFQHLCFRLKNRVFSIVFAFRDWSEPNGKLATVPFFPQFLQICEENNLIPCVMIADTRGWFWGEDTLYHASNLEKINLQNYDFSEGIPMSKWEIHNFGIIMALNNLDNQGCTEISFCNIPGYNPQIFFKKDDIQYMAFVRAIPAGLNNETYTIDRKVLEDHKEYVPYFFNIEFNNEHNNGDFQDTILWRDDRQYTKIGLYSLQEALNKYHFISIQ